MKKQATTVEAAVSGLRGRIVEHGASLSPQQRVIADYLLAHLEEAPFLSILEVSERTGASEATVVRFAQRIGYKGYAGLKMALVEALREERGSGRRTTASAATQAPLAAVARLAQHNIEATLASVDGSEFEAVAQQLAGADHLFTFGLGISAHLADLAAYLFTEHGLRVNSLTTRYTSPREQLVALRPGDAVLAFSLPPYSRETLEVLREARERGATTVVVTDRATAPAVSLVDHALTVSCQGMTFTSTTAAIDVVLNALVMAIGAHHREEALEAISRINQILEGDSSLVD
ncbi:MurR/RpiR family transcriptional regulator [Parahaliea aestuarii]|nr:MurR/RpiR family transcriptional regulator [Parahaliea aestuarii]